MVPSLPALLAKLENHIQRFAVVDKHDAALAMANVKRLALPATDTAPDTSRM